MFFAAFWLILVHVWPLVLGAAIRPKLPSKDWFYEAPQNISSYYEGEIIRFRRTSSKLRGIYLSTNIQTQWQFLVRTTNSQGNATAVITTVLKPYNADNKKVLSYQFAQDSSSLDCAPSYSILENSKINTILLQLQLYVTNVALSKGWHVVAPDHEGQASAFAMSRLAGQATLDSIRAVLGTEEITGVEPDAKVALWGYSGGTVPTSWASILQPKYAPELKHNLVGVAVGGWLTNLTEAALRMDGTIFSGLIPLAIHGLLNEHPELEVEVLSYILDEEDRRDLMDARELCLVEALPKYTMQNFFTGDSPIFSSGEGIFGLPRVKQAIESNVLGVNITDGVPQIPLFAYHGLVDEIVPFEQTTRAFESLCQFGVESFELALSESTGHITEMLQGTGAALKWIEDRFNGVPAVTGCVANTRKTNLEYPGADFGFYELFRSTWEAALGKELGKTPVQKMSKSAEFLFSSAKRLLRLLGPIPLK